MSIYVDPLSNCLKSKKWNHSLACHMVADSLKELHDFGASIGLNMMWFQNRDHLPHYDLTKGMRKKAVKAGAIEITVRQIVDRLRASRKAGRKSMRTIIAGSRDITDMHELIKATNDCGWTVTTVISGGAKGADALGEQWADGYGIPVEKYPADWDTHGKSAGYKRNEQMANVADALIALWDGQSRGTQHMIDIAKKKGLRVYVKNINENTMASNGTHADVVIVTDESYGGISPEIQTLIEESKMETTRPIDIQKIKDAFVYPPGAVLPVLAFDTETELISRLNPIPPVMCMSYANAGDLQGSIKTPWEHDIQKHLIDSWMSGQHGVAHNTCFDLSVLAFTYPDLLPHIFDALDKGLLHDTLIREKLLMLTLHGNFEMIEVNGCNIRLSYTQVALEQKYLKVDRSAEKDDPDAPRMNYAMWKNVPLAKWDAASVDYSITDSVNCGLIYRAQEIEREKCIRDIDIDPFKVETFRVKVSFALRLLECIGDRMDPEWVIKVSKRFRTEYAQPRLRNPLLAAGLLTDAIPPVPHKKGTLAHTDACNAAKGSADQKALRKDKTCGCPPKMKAAEPEHNPQRPLFQYIWNLAANNPNIKAWPSDGCASMLRKAEVYKSIVKNKAFTSEVIASTDINIAVAAITEQLKVATAAHDDKAFNKLGQEATKLQVLINAGHTVLLPDDIKLKTNEEWSSNFSAHDPLLEIWAERKALRKIITDYLPKLHYINAEGVEVPAPVVRGSYYPLCLTGRSSSSSSDFYPSRNQQNVDPRVRPCTIPRDGNIIISTDYSGMELGTLAQKCFELFGYSTMMDNINAGIDNHAYLAAQIAAALDPVFDQAVILYDLDGKYSEIHKTFEEFKDNGAPCPSPAFCQSFSAKYMQENNKPLDRSVLWSDFFEYYRLLAKPTGLGFPGGLGAATMVSYAKGGYKIDLSIELAKKLRDIWLESYPEMGPYLEWINKFSKDPHHTPEPYEDDDGKTKTRTFYSYGTPRGMYRARCGYCEAANGAALQAPSAEGALEGLYRAQKVTWLNDYDGPLDDIVLFLDTFDPNRVMGDAFLINFIHDENLWEALEDANTNERVAIMERLMVDAMQEITPNVKASCESVAMRRWYKKAKPVFDETGNLVPWEPPVEVKEV